MEKKEYKKPLLKAMHVEEHLMLDLSNGEGNGEQFSKETFDEPSNDQSQLTIKSVWED